jgi:hypothetical protein
MRLLSVVALAGLLTTSPAIAQDQDAVASMERKLDHMETNGALPQPDTTPTDFTEPEINSYLAAGKVELPTGVRSVAFHGEPGVITGTASIDFDQVRAGRSSMNPLLSVFSGIHRIVVVAHAQGGGREAVVHVDSVDLDGVEIPRFVLQSFVEKFLRPKYPKVGLDSRFSLPEKIDTATVGQQKLSVTQK